MCSVLLFIDSTNYTCVACNETCAECVGPADNQCTACSGGRHLDTDHKCTAPNATTDIVLVFDPNTVDASNITEQDVRDIIAQLVGSDVVWSVDIEVVDGFVTRVVVSVDAATAQDVVDVLQSALEDDATCSAGVLCWATHTFIETQSVTSIGWHTRGAVLCVFVCQWLVLSTCMG